MKSIYLAWLQPWIPSLPSQNQAHPCHPSTHGKISSGSFSATENQMLA